MRLPTQSLVPVLWALASVVFLVRCAKLLSRKYGPSTAPHVLSAVVNLDPVIEEEVHRQTAVRETVGREESPKHERGQPTKMPRQRGCPRHGRGG